MDATEINEAGADAAELAEDAAEVASEFEALVEAHPFGMLVGAVGVGYLVGGGLFTSLTRRLLGVGVRLGFQLALLPAVEREVASMAGDLGKSLGNLGDAMTASPPQ